MTRNSHRKARRPAGLPAIRIQMVLRPLDHDHERVHAVGELLHGWHRPRERASELCHSSNRICRPHGQRDGDPPRTRDGHVIDMHRMPPSALADLCFCPVRPLGSEETVEAILPEHRGEPPRSQPAALPSSGGTSGRPLRTMGKAPEPSAPVARIGLARPSHRPTHATHQ